MRLITIDFESYYDQDFSLSKLTTEEYIRGEQFQVIGVAVKVDGAPTRWFSGDHEDIKKWLQQFPWDTSIAVAHNAMFDMAILNWHFDIRPKAIADTLSMARAIHGIEVGGSLAKLAAHYKLGVKGEEVIKAKGKYRIDFAPDELQRYGEYCKNDVELTYKLFLELFKGCPLQELRLIDLTLRMFTEPVLELDAFLLEKHLSEVVARKDQLLATLGGDPVLVKKSLMSNPQFAQLLRDFGVEPPTKISLTTGKLTYAFAKTDEGMKELLEHPDDRVQTLAAVRLGVKGTLEETRTKRFIEIANRGTLPIPLKYYAAHTSRWGGSEKINLQNLPSRGENANALKKAILAPAGHVIIDCDSSQIECVSGDTLVLTKDRGYVRIVDILKSDLLWDGVEWVSHDGVVYKGHKEVITYAGITGTPNHIVYLADGRRVHLSHAKDEGAALAVGERGGKPVRYVDSAAATNPTRESAVNLGAVRANGGIRPEAGEAPVVHTVPVFDIVNAGPRHRFTANGVVVSNCRVLAWMSGQEDLVEAFAKGEDVYKIMASAIYGVPVEEITSAQRFIGKTVILGSGYGLGHAKFHMFMKAAKVAMSLDEARHIISTYRMTYPMIPKLWEQGNRCLAALVDGQVAPYGRPGVVEIVDRAFHTPLGIPLSYHRLRRHTKPNGDTEFVYTSRTGITGIWGGKLTENLIQHLARVVIGQQMLKIAKRYRVVLTVHDAIACVAPEGEAEEARQYVEECMRWVPEWAPGLPLNCESGMGGSYGEC